MKSEAGSVILDTSTHSSCAGRRSADSSRDDELFILQRSSWFVFFSRRVHSGQIWETRLINKLFIYCWISELWLLFVYLNWSARYMFWLLFKFSTFLNIHIFFFFVCDPNLQTNTRMDSSCWCKIPLCFIKKNFKIYMRMKTFKVKFESCHNFNSHEI